MNHKSNEDEGSNALLLLLIYTMPKKSKRASKLTRALAKKSAASSERAKRITEHAARNNDKPGVHPKKPLIQDYTDDECEVFLIECLAEALLTKNKAISQRKENTTTAADEHRFMHDILQRDNVLRMVNGVLAYCKQRSDALVFESLNDVISFFDSCDINIRHFYGEDDELQSRFEADPRSTFLKRMMIYSFRNMQCACGKCGKRIVVVRYGAIGYESNHIFDDLAKDENERRKSFEVSCTNFSIDVCDLLFEVCKTDLECMFCHNKLGTCLYEDLPGICEGTYNFSIKMCFEAQDSNECKKALACIQSLCENRSTHSFEHICTVFEIQTDFFYKDCFLFTEDCWDNATSSTRKVMLHRIYLIVEKRMTGGCLLCKTIFCNLPARELMGIDLHHIEWVTKEFNPSEGVTKSFSESLSENRKCGPLCRLCHLMVHNKPGQNTHFMSMLGSNGYVVDTKTGEILRSVTDGVEVRHR